MTKVKIKINFLNDKLILARKLYTREGFYDEFIKRLDGKKTATAVYYEVEMLHDDIFGVFKFPTLNAFYVWTCKRRQNKFKEIRKK